MRTSRRRLLRQGFVVNLLNPKTAVFFLAFLPQFVDPARGTAWLQAVVLGMVFIALGMLSDGLYALAAGAVGERLRRSARMRRWLDRLTGCVYLGLGVFTALARTTDPGPSMAR